MILNSKTRNLIYFAYTLFLSLFFLTNICWFINLASANKFTVLHENDTLYLKDFIQYYRDGKIAVSADHNKIYDRETRLKWLNQLIKPESTENPLLTQGPPLQVLLILPFLIFPICQAHLAWGLFSLSIGLAAIAFLLGGNLKSKPKRSLLILLGTAASIPGLNTIFLGQTSWYVLSMSAFYWWAWLKKRYWLAGLFLALSIVKFQYAPFWLIPALAKRRYSLVFSMSLGIILTFVITGLLFGWQNIWDYPKTFWHIEKDTNVNAPCMISLRGLLSFLFPQQTSLLLSIFFMFACLIFLFWLWSSVKESNLLISITVITALLTAAHVFSIDSILLSIPAALMLPGLKVSNLFDGANKITLTNLAVQAYYLILLLFPLLTILFLILFASYDYLSYFAMNLILFIGALFLDIKKPGENDNLVDAN